MALADALCGNRQSAIDALEQLWIDHPRFHLTAIALCELLLDSNLPTRVIEVSTTLATKLPQDASIPFLESRALRRLGKIEEAQAACDRALALAPDDGRNLAHAAALELDRGHVEQWMGK